MRQLFAVCFTTLMLGIAPNAGADLILSTGFGGSNTQSLTGLTLGNSISFNYMYSDVTYASGPWIGFNASVINPLLGTSPIGQFNDYKPTNTSLLSGTIDTSSGFGTIHDLAFTANTFGATGNSAVVTVSNIAIDGKLVQAVPEPGSLALLGAGLLCLGLLRRIRTA